MATLSYRPGSFRKEFETQLGQDIWAFLNEQRMIDGLEKASDLGHPAVAGIEEELLERFDAAVLEDRIKMMIGHMVRQILEPRGWVIDRENVQIASLPFFKGTRYRRAGGFSAQVFRLSTNPRQLCLVRDRIGSRLPPAPEGGRWTYWCAVSSRLRASVALGLSDTAAATAAILAQGYYLHEVPRLLRAA